MAGLVNEVLFAENVDFSGGSPPSAQITADGQLLIGATASPNIRVGTISGGTNIDVTNSPGAISISGTGIAGFMWSEVTGTTQAASPNAGYITNNAALVTVTLPSTISVGDIIRVVGKGAGGWRVAQNAGQTIHFGNTDTTTGAGGRLDSSDQYDAIELLCITADTDFAVLNSIGNILVT